MSLEKNRLLELSAPITVPMLAVASEPAFATEGELEDVPTAGLPRSGQRAHQGARGRCHDLWTVAW
ncbi:hypothetical protein [Lentzea flaviverrucosa]|uniref:hypothetical protein n=1 Tax=Lentzea flaviverrucosa TaxID=200379 RepID=UPI00116038EB|nr:hypothetical protein [Lentzea flaviverrucosa]